MQISEAATGTPIMAGMFPANGYPFNSGASHTFISTSFVVGNSLEFDLTKDD